MAVVKIIFDGVQVPFDTVKAAAEQAVMVTKIMGPSTVRLRVRTDLADKLVLELTDSVLSYLSQPFAC
jgi:hypothetical protein